MASQRLGRLGVDWASLPSRGLRASPHGLASELVGLPHNVVAVGVLLGSPGLQNIWRDLRSHKVTYMCFMSGDSHNGPPRAQGGDTDATSYWGNSKLSGEPVGWKTLLQDLGASTSATFILQGMDCRETWGLGLGTGHRVFFSLEATVTVPLPSVPRHDLHHRQQHGTYSPLGSPCPQEVQAQGGLGGLPVPGLPFKTHFLSEDLPLSP